MRLVKLLPQLVLGVAVCVIVSGCAVINYDAPVADDFNLTAKMKTQYCIVSAESVTIDALSKGKEELELLNVALNNFPGNNFGESWRKVLVELKKKPGNLHLGSTSLTSWKLNTRSIAPTLFELSKGVPVNVRAVIFVRPESINPWWTMAYLLTGTILAPMQSQSLGAASVAILDNNGKTLDVRTVIFSRSSWFSTLFPWALCGGGEFSVKSAGTAPDLDEKNLQIRVMSQMIVEMLTSTPVKQSPNWRNIRAAAVEAIISDNNNAALKLIKSASAQNLGGKECKNFLEILD